MLKILLLIAALGVAPLQAQASPQCRPAGPLVKVPELPEGSGVAVSRRDPARAWAHNDSGKPVLVTLNDQGVTTGRVQLTGASVDDWETMSIGPCPSGSCLYVGDIGDNDAERKRITVYRVAEPSAASATATAELFHATYPDGPHDAETLLVTPKGEIYVVTKGDTGDVALYKFPAEMRAGGTVALARVGKARDRGTADDRITDGAVSPNGEWVVLRTNRTLRFHRAAELFAGNWREAGRVDLAQFGEPQGEGIAFGNDTTLYLIGEGGGKSQPGTFARMTCTF